MAIYLEPFYGVPGGILFCQLHAMVTNKGINMANEILFPSLSEDGWVDSPSKRADLLLSHALISDYSQTYSYLGYVTSIPWILQETQGDMARTVTLMQTKLSNYFSRYYNNVVIEVAEVENTDDPSKAQIRLYINLTDNSGNVINIGKMLQIADTKLEKIITINNG